MKRGIAYAGMAGAAWGLVFLMPKLLPEFSPLMISCGRFLLYGAVSLLVAAPRARRLLAMLTRTDLLLLVQLALLGNLLYYMLLSASVQMAGVATASLIIGVLPVTITLAGRRDSGAVPLARLAWPLTMVIAGIACINLDTLLAADAEQASVMTVATGVVCGFGALLCWTIFAVVNTRHLKKSHINSSDWATLWGIVSGLLSIPIWLLAQLFSVGGTGIEAPPERWLMFWGVCLTAAIFASWFGNRMWNAASRRLPMTLGGQLIVFETLFALLYGFIYAHRLPGALEIAAMLLLIGGVCWTVRRHAPSAAPAH
ncbi:DMT family transporter [Janthinobacterium agaricidamnosum]|uniref:EamA domain-containing protein n=1 Tax=Janthinobacterium agaricidamnosum NBRC 102515 = DSM 9628 TaxID=1349767 RepID=W0V8I4_9BURK|nr:DMT family transporter [Janthinobacterium agaricidamnosum]CDG83658.1 conserved hypothetical protein [Janthinobacterium agaricidamnosum NBRC 102515 = DSM 9628]